MSRCLCRDPITGLICILEAEPGTLSCRLCAEKSARDKTGFSAWMQATAQALEALCGLFPEDLPDCLYADWYAAGMTPEVAARYALAAFQGEEIPA